MVARQAVDGERGGRPRVSTQAAGQRLVPVVRVGKVVTGNVSSSRRRRSSCPASAGGVAGAGAVRRGRGRGVGSGDLCARGGHQPPLRAEVVAALAVSLPGGGVTDEVVQRVTVVGHLLSAVGPGDRAQVARLRAPGGGQRAGRRHRRPGRRARPEQADMFMPSLAHRYTVSPRPVGQERPRRADMGGDHRPGRRRAGRAPRGRGRAGRRRGRRGGGAAHAVASSAEASGITSLTGSGTLASSERIIFIVSSRAAMSAAPDRVDAAALSS